MFGQAAPAIEPKTVIAEFRSKIEEEIIGYRVRTRGNKFVGRLAVFTYHVIEGGSKWIFTGFSHRCRTYPGSKRATTQLLLTQMFDDNSEEFAADRVVQVHVLSV